MNQREKIVEALRKNIDWTNDNGQLPELADAIREALKEGNEPVATLTRYGETQRKWHDDFGPLADGNYVKFDDAQAIITVQQDELYCAEQELDSNICDLPDSPEAQTEFDCLCDYIRYVHSGMKAIIAQKDAENAALTEECQTLRADSYVLDEGLVKVEAERDALRKDDKKLRSVLGIIYSQGMAYMDDGECQDNRSYPFIDFMRDTPEKIELSMRERAVRAIAAQRRAGR